MTSSSDSDSDSVSSDSEKIEVDNPLIDSELLIFQQAAITDAAVRSIVPDGAGQRNFSGRLDYEDSLLEAPPLIVKDLMVLAKKNRQG